MSGINYEPEDIDEYKSKLKEALLQIQEFRKKCDPNEETVLVTTIESLADHYLENRRWFYFDAVGEEE